MSAILLLLSRVASVVQTALAVFSFVKKAGAAEKENEILKERAEQDAKKISELAESNAFRARLERDPAYAERMRKLLNGNGNGKGDKDSGTEK
jgi:hypothetical protein